MSFKRNTPWTAQPQYPVELDPDHWLVKRGITLYAPLGVGFGQVFEAIVPLKQSPLAPTPDSAAPGQGLVTKFDGTNTLAVPTPRAPVLFDSNAFTVCAWFKAVDVTNNHNLFGQGTSGSASNRIALQAVGAVAGDPIRLVVTTNGSVQILAVSTTGYAANTWAFAAASKSGNIGAAYINGGSKGTHTATMAGAAIANDVRVGWIPGAPDGVALAGDMIAHVMVLPYAATDEEIARIYLEQRVNPWLIFRPLKKNIYVEDAASGVSAALTGQSITAGLGSLVADITAPITSQSITIGQGTVAVDPGAISAAITGQSASVALGNVSAVVSVAITGQSITSSLGTMVPAFERAITGQGLTVSVGGVVAAVAPTLSGQSVTVSLGSAVVVGGSVSRTLSGQGLTVSLGIISTIWTTSSATSGTWTDSASSAGVWTDKPLSSGTWTTL